MNNIAEKVFNITVEYIGPAAQRFLERQTVTHLSGLKLEDLERQHIPELARWVKISAGLLIDSSRAEELASKIARI